MNVKKLFLKALNFCHYGIVVVVLWFNNIKLKDFLRFLHIINLICHLCNRHGCTLRINCHCYELLGHALYSCVIFSYIFFSYFTVLLFLVTHFIVLVFFNYIFFSFSILTMGQKVRLRSTFAQTAG